MDGPTLKSSPIVPVSEDEARKRSPVVRSVTKMSSPRLVSPPAARLSARESNATLWPDDEISGSRLLSLPFTPRAVIEARETGAGTLDAVAGPAWAAGSAFGTASAPAAGRTASTTMEPRTTSVDRILRMSPSPDSTMHGEATSGPRRAPGSGSAGIIEGMPHRAVHDVSAIFRILRDRELRSFWMSDWVSDAGSFVTFIALAVYVNKLTGSPVAVGVALALRSVPWFTIGPLAGVLADRMDRRRVMVASNLIRAALVALLPFTTELWQIYTIALASAVFGPLFRSARSALLPLVAPEQRLVPALAVMETTHQVLHTVGPAFGGLVVLLVGARPAFFVDSASFLLASAFLLGVRARGRPEGERSSALSDLRGGLRGLLGAPAVRTYVLLGAALNLGWGGVIALLVVYVRAVVGLGTVLSSLAIAARDERHSRRPWAVASVLGLGAFAAILWTPSLLAMLPVALVAGLADAGVGIPLSATLAETLPDALRGRAYSVAAALTELAAAAGSVGFAWLADGSRLGVTHSMALAVGVGCALGLVVLATGGAAAIG